MVQRDQDICMWITEEKMEVWQIDLYHRNTEDDGIHIQRNSSAIGSRPNDRFNLRDREKVKIEFFFFIFLTIFTKIDSSTTTSRRLLTRLYS